MKHLAPGKGAIKQKKFFENFCSEECSICISLFLYSLPLAPVIEVNCYQKSRKLELKISTQTEQQFFSDSISWNYLISSLKSRLFNLSVIDPYQTEPNREAKQ